MTRAQQTISVFLLVSSLYLALYLGLVPLNETIQDEIVPVLPFYGLICVACFLGARLGWNIMTFNDVPEAYASLQKEIDQAKAELRKAKIDVDWVFEAFFFSFPFTYSASVPQYRNRREYVQILIQSWTCICENWWGNTLLFCWTWCVFVKYSNLVRFSVRYIIHWHWIQRLGGIYYGQISSRLKGILCFIWTFSESLPLGVVQGRGRKKKKKGEMTTGLMHVCAFHLWFLLRQLDIAEYVSQRIPPQKAPHLK